ncbi:MAG: PHP domain-containing protein [Paludisphaera borealis]|uniref:PHP domain-containing protein n=1 Tax=Paludisphaera borealis TaxID=1387353 RepID=UPI00283DB205|nr:PHP domain-containing protein [Paludisphaera borealis]MDR3619007.1 PHP domain-containing protein [Paludisphaera borealis]
MKFDHHLHTSRHSPDSVMDPLEMIKQARAVGLDGVVITEHDYQWKADELAELASRANGLKVFSGVEVSAREGHFLVYGLPDLTDAGPGIALADLLRLVDRHQAAVVAAHPFRWSQPFDAIVAQHGPVFHGVEYVSNNVTPETRGLADALLRTTPMPATGSSDAHDVETLGCYYSEFEAPIESMADFVAALRKGAVRPRHRQGKVRLSSGPVD